MVKRIVVGVGATVLLALSFPAWGTAKIPVEDGAREALPGITVTGIGFAPASTEAVEKAIRDARKRAGSIARALRLDLGAVESLELPDLAQFGAPRPCPGERGKPRRCQSVPTVAAATATFAIAGGATSDAACRSVLTHGVASALIKPDDRSRNRAVRRAVLAVRRDLAPEAAVLARRSARTAAGAAGIHLGPIVSVAERAPAYYGATFYDSALGSFGPGRFCGIVKRPIVRRDPETGVKRVVRRVRQRRCFVPSPYSVHFAIRYEAR